MFFTSFFLESLTLRNERLRDVFGAVERLSVFVTSVGLDSKQIKKSKGRFVNRVEKPVGLILHVIRSIDKCENSSKKSSTFVGCLANHSNRSQSVELVPFFRTK